MSAEKPTSEASELLAGSIRKVGDLRAQVLALTERLDETSKQLDRLRDEFDLFVVQVIGRDLIYDQHGAGWSRLAPVDRKDP